MKRKFLVVLLALISLLSFNISAQETNYSITVPEGFSATDKSDNMEAVANQLGLDLKALNEYFDQNGLIYLAVSADAKTQIRLSALSDNFSSAVSDISFLDEQGLADFTAAIGGENKTEIIEKGNRKFVKTVNTLRDSGGIYTVSQYVTIADNATYYLSCYNDGTTTSAQVDEIFKSFNIFSQKPTAYADDKPSFTKTIILASIGGVIFLAVAVFMAIGILKPYLKEKKVSKRNENQ